jgi:hypothetical protein
MAHPTKAVFKKLSTKIRHVVNISYPHDPSSVNRNIERLTRLANVSFEQAASIVAELGAGTLLYKFDIVSAYKLVASLPQGWHLQGELEMIDGVKHYSFPTTTCFGAASSADVFHDLGKRSRIHSSLCYRQCRHRQVRRRFSRAHPTTRLITCARAGHGRTRPHHRRVRRTGSSHR